MRGKPSSGTAFAALFALESGARAMMTSVVPILSYDILASAQRVSVLNTAVSFAALVTTLLIPQLTARLARRHVYTLGAAALIVAGAFFALGSLPGQLVGMALRMFGASALSITLNLYIMDAVRKEDLVRVEARRMMWATATWTLGPATGVFLYDRFGVVAPAAAAAAFALALLALFWHLRLTEGSVIQPGSSRPPNPLANIARFAAQPRLRLAWFIAFSRSAFWTTAFVYGPLLMVITGQGKLAGGLLVSAISGLLVLAGPWGWAGRRFGVRRTITLAFGAMTLLLAGAAASGEAMPLLTAGLLLAASAFCTALDALGSTPFLRAVKRRERAEMTSVYRTFLELSDLASSFAYSLTLAFFGLGSVFLVLALLIAAAAAVSWRHLPRAM